MSDNGSPNGHDIWRSEAIRLDQKIDGALKRVEYVAEEWNTIFGKGVSRVEGAGVALAGKFTGVLRAMKKLDERMHTVEVKTDHGNKMLEMLLKARGLKIPKLGT